ncbi:MAG: PASTA domain-containing protein [Deltaproteobacteria bacterium]|nr:PASTA domain-containing protein [Deltaproteobacteria bacterium]
MKARILAVGGGIAVLLAMVALRIVQFTLTQSPDLAERARRQHHEQIHIAAHRGTILDRHGETLASSVERPSVYVRPPRLNAADRRRAQAALGEALGLSSHAVAEKLASRSNFVWLKRAVSPREQFAVQSLGIAGLDEVTEARRFYPHGVVAAQVIGATSVDLLGVEGIEQVYERDLRALTRTLEIERDALGREILTDGMADPRTLDGATVQLTIDVGLQTIAEGALEAGVREARAAAGTAIVLDPWTGEILALANAPTFDPNHRGTVPPANRRNRAINDFYEPGSTFKAVLAAAALEYGVVRPDEMLFCEHGAMPVGKWVIHDHHRHGWLSMSEAIAVSSNIAAAKIGERLGRDRFHPFLVGLGFGTPTGVDLPGEVGGMLRPVGDWSRINLMTTSFGQGVAVTPLQMARAFAAIANGGQLVRPYVGLRATSATGEELWTRQPHLVRRVMRPETAKAVTAMLEQVVEDGGTGTRAQIAGVRVAGKTGTSQKVEPGTGRYSADARVASFVGFLPAEAPKLVILVMIDEPRTSKYGGMVAAPVFRAIGAAALEREGLVPTQPSPELQQAALEPAAPAAPLVPLGVPSFLGLSKRMAVERARDLGWMVQVTGEGYVQSQTPAPGAAEAPGKELVLSLAPSSDLL